MSVTTATQEAEIGKIGIGGQPGKKLVRHLSQQIKQVWQYMPVIPATREAKVG
jgi:hypothetical protein